MNSSGLGSLSRRVACAAASARGCLSSSSAAVSAAGAHTHASTLHGARNSGGTGGLLPVQRSSYCLVLCSQVHTGTRRVKGGVFRSGRRLAEAGVIFGRLAVYGEQVVGHLPGTGIRRARAGAVALSLHPEVPDTNSCHLSADWASSNQWAGRRC